MQQSGYFSRLRDRILLYFCISDHAFNNLHHDLVYYAELQITVCRTKFLYTLCVVPLLFAQFISLTVLSVLILFQVFTNSLCLRVWVTSRPLSFNAPWLSWLQRPTVRLRNHPQSEGREFEPHWGRAFLYLRPDIQVILRDFVNDKVVWL